MEFTIQLRDIDGEVMDGFTFPVEVESPESSADEDYDWGQDPECLVVEETLVLLNRLQAVAEQWAAEMKQQHRSTRRVWTVYGRTPGTMFWDPICSAFSSRFADSIAHQAADDYAESLVNPPGVTGGTSGEREA